MKARACLLVLALATPAAHADIPPPPGTPIYDVSPQMVFENLKDYPQHAFYLKLKYCRGGGNAYWSPHLTALEHGEPVAYSGVSQRLTEVYLVAAPKNLKIEPPPQNGAADKWLATTQKGTVQIEAHREMPLGTEMTN